MARTALCKALRTNPVCLFQASLVKTRGNLGFANAYLSWVRKSAPEEWNGLNVELRLGFKSLLCHEAHRVNLGAMLPLATQMKGARVEGDGKVCPRRPYQIAASE